MLIIIHFNFCNECFTTSGDYGSCGGCGEMWFARCDKDTEKWTYAGKDCCELCFSTELSEITTEALLEFVLNKTGLDQTSIRKEMRLLPEYSKPKNVYVCQTHEDCASNQGCTELSYGEERGFCCMARFGDDKQFFCSFCSKKQRTNQD